MLLFLFIILAAYKFVHIIEINNDADSMRSIIDRSLFNSRAAVHAQITVLHCIIHTASYTDFVHAHDL